MRLKVSLHGFARYLKALGANAKPAVVRGLQSGAARAIPLLQAATDKAPPASDNGAVGAFDTGAFRRGWRTRATASGVEIENISNHAPFVEGGRRRNKKMPPRQVIQAWAKRRLGLSDSEAKAAAFPIAQAIAKRGLRGRKIMPRSREVIIRACRQEIRIELERALQASRRAARTGVR